MTFAEDNELVIHNLRSVLFLGLLKAPHLGLDRDILFALVKLTLKKDLLLRFVVVGFVYLFAEFEVSIHNDEKHAANFPFFYHFGSPGNFDFLDEAQEPFERCARPLLKQSDGPKPADHVILNPVLHVFKVKVEVFLRNCEQQRVFGRRRCGLSERILTRKSNFAEGVSRLQPFPFSVSFMCLHFLLQLFDFFYFLFYVKLSLNGRSHSFDQGLFVFSF